MLDQQFILGKAYKVKFKSLFERHGVCTTAGLTCLHKGGGVFRLEQIASFRDVVLAGVKLYDNFFAPVGITEEEYHQYFNGKPEDEYTPEYATVDVETQTTTPSTTVINGETVVTPTTIVKSHKVFKETGNSLLKKHFADNVSYAEYPIYKFVDVIDAEDAIYAPELTIDGFPDIDIAEYKNLNLVLHLGYFDDPAQLDPMLLSIRDRMALYGLKARNIKLYSSGSKWLTPLEYEGIKSIRKPADLVTIGEEKLKSPDDHLFEHIVTDGGLKQIVGTVTDSDNEVALSDITKKQIVLDNQLFITEVKPNEVFDNTSIYYISVDGTTEHLRLMEPTACIPGKEIMTFTKTLDTTPFVARDTAGNIILDANNQPKYRKKYFRCINDGMRKVSNDDPREYQEGTYYVKGYTKVYRQVPGGSAIIAGASYYKRDSVNTNFEFVDSSTWDGSVPYTTDVTYYRLDLIYPTTPTYRLATEDEIADSSGKTELYLKYNFMYEEVTDLTSSDSPYELGYYESDHVYFKESYVTNSALSCIGRKFDYLDEYHYPKTMQLMMTDLIDIADAQTNVTLPGIANIASFTETISKPVPVDTVVEETTYTLEDQEKVYTYDRTCYVEGTETRTQTDTVTGYTVTEGTGTTTSEVTLPTPADISVAWIQAPNGIITLGTSAAEQAKWRALIEDIDAGTFRTNHPDPTEKFILSGEVYIALSYSELFDLVDAYWQTIPGSHGVLRYDAATYTESVDGVTVTRHATSPEGGINAEWVSDEMRTKAKAAWLANGNRQYAIILFRLPSELADKSFSLSDISVNYDYYDGSSTTLPIIYDLMRLYQYGPNTCAYVKYWDKLGKVSYGCDSVTFNDSLVNTSIVNDIRTYLTQVYDDRNRLFAYANAGYLFWCKWTRSTSRTDMFKGYNSYDHFSDPWYFTLRVSVGGESYKATHWLPMDHNTMYYMNASRFTTFDQGNYTSSRNSTETLSRVSLEDLRLNGSPIAVRETAVEDIEYATFTRAQLLSTSFFGREGMPPTGCPVAIDYIAQLMTEDNRENILQLWGVPPASGTFTSEYDTAAKRCYTIQIPDDTTMRTKAVYQYDEVFYNIVQLMCRLTQAERTRLLSTYTENQQLQIQRAYGLKSIEATMPLATVTEQQIQVESTYTVPVYTPSTEQVSITKTIKVPVAHTAQVPRPLGSYEIHTETRVIPVGNSISGDFDRYYGRKFRYTGDALTQSEITEGKLTTTHDVVLSPSTIGLVAGKTGVLLGRVGQLSKPTYIYDPDQEKRNYFIRYKLESQDNQFLRGKLAEYENVLEQQFSLPTTQGN